MNELINKVAVVTGGNGGLGLAMAKSLADAGATLAIIGRDPAKNALAQIALKREFSPEPKAYIANLTDEQSVADTIAQIVARFGGVDILINNAGSNERKLPQDYSISEWNGLIASNLTSAFITSQCVYPLMCARGGGKIVNIGSMLSLFGSAMSAPYAAAKGGIVQMTKSLAHAWAGDNIQVNAILPGWIETDLTVTAKRQISGLHDHVLARTPAARWGRPEDVGGAARFLCSPAADFITGASLPVDGGFSCAV
jgi:2-dehydro-3-deoxy-D-gluconate 5-dehydrogenase